MTQDADTRFAILTAALPHVAFDGWSETTFRAAIADSEVDPALAKTLFPRGAIDLAAAWHHEGDAAMTARLSQAAFDGMRYRDKVAFALRTRIEVIPDREAVRRATTLFALPHHAPEGARLVWGTADAIWTALGDTSRDVNWYTKRMTLSAVYSSTVLYWLGDDSLDNQATWDFLDRRIEDVMRVEQAKASVRNNRALSGLMAGPNWLMSRIRAPEPNRASDLPGGWTAPR